jgi:hypothetical protein
MNSLAKGMSVLVIGAVTMLGIEAQFFKEEPQRDDRLLTLQRSEDDKTLSTLQQELTDLRNRLTRLEHAQPQVTRLRNRLTALEDKQQALEGAVDTVRSPNVALAPGEAIDGSATEQQASDGERQQKLRALFATQFSRESDDASWSRQTEASLSQAVTHAAFDGSRILAIGCRTSLCQLEVGHDSEAAREEFVEDFPFTLPFDTEVFYQRLEEAGGKESTVMYLARAGQHLPTLP